MPIKEPVSKRTMTVALPDFNRAVALLNLPAHARYSDDQNVRAKAIKLGANDCEKTRLGHVDFEDSVSIELWLCSDNSGYFASWNVYHPAKQTQTNEVLMLMQEETIIAHRHRYQVTLDIQ